MIFLLFHYALWVYYIIINIELLKVYAIKSEEQVCRYQSVYLIVHAYSDAFECDVAFVYL